MPLADWYFEVPPVTRSYVTGAIIVTASCSLDLISPFSLFFNLNLVFTKLQLWRLFTNFFFFGALGVDFLFHMFFLARYCRLLEEGSFRGRTSDFALMLLFGGLLMCLASAVVSVPPFLGSSLAFMMVYVWARRNDDVRMSFLGLFTFRAPYLPWVLLGFSVLLGNSPSVDLMGIVVGHLYFFLDDVYPYTRAGKGRRPLRTPQWLRAPLQLLSEVGNMLSGGEWTYPQRQAGFGRVVHTPQPAPWPDRPAEGAGGEGAPATDAAPPAAGMGEAPPDAAAAAAAGMPAGEGHDGS